MPWNFPFQLAIKCAIPQLVAGNTLLFKSAPNVPQCGIALEEVFVESGFVNHEFQNVFFDYDQTEFLISDKRVRGVAFTGSSAGGKAVGEIAGRHLKKTLLELGGSDPFIVLDDADLEEAAKQGASSRLKNSG